MRTEDVNYENRTPNHRSADALERIAGALEALVEVAADYECDCECEDNDDDESTVDAGTMLIVSKVLKPLRFI